jgi:predicted secreted hydrolase
MGTKGSAERKRSDIRIRFPIWLVFFALILPFETFGADQFTNAVPGRKLEFPRDHGAHGDFQTEWWYFTGNLKSEEREWGFQLTFFRRGMFKDPPGTSSWAVGDLYPAHFAITDVTGNRFLHSELITRRGPGLASISNNTLDARVRDWTALMVGDEIRLRAKQNSEAISLILKPVKPAVLHGDSGFSQKGYSADQASYYYSFTNLETSGTLTFDGKDYAVVGKSWMDHEFGSSILEADQIGWDWFSLQLDDGAELMLFHLRRKDGSLEKPFGTYIRPDGSTMKLRGDQILITSRETWKSPHTKSEYPSRWNIEIPEIKLNLDVQSKVKDQELASGSSTGVVYWEGTVRAMGTIDNVRILGNGYVELTGYAASMEGLL